MRHDKIIKREDGTQYKICVEITIDSYTRGVIRYDIHVLYRDKGKRKWHNIPDTIGDREYGRLSMDGRRIYNNDNHLRFITNKEILEVKLELWKLLKPE
jgi:hypothetical protein